MESIIFTRRTQTGSELKAERSCNTGRALHYHSRCAPPSGAKVVSAWCGLSGCFSKKSQSGLRFSERPSRRSPLQALISCLKAKRNMQRAGTLSSLSSTYPACHFSVFGNENVLPSLVHNFMSNLQSLHASVSQNSVQDLPVQKCLGLISCCE